MAPSSPVDKLTGSEFGQNMRFVIFLGFPLTNYFIVPFIFLWSQLGMLKESREIILWSCSTILRRKDTAQHFAPERDNYPTGNYQLRLFSRTSSSQQKNLILKTF